MLKLRTLWMLLAAALIMAGLFAWLDRGGFWLQGWWAYGLVFGLSAVVLYLSWRNLGGDSAVLRTTLGAWILRLGLGLGLFLLLPIFGYQDNIASQAGYLYKDAFFRDQQSWELAASHDSLGEAFSGRFSGDQYGGLLALSAAVYRVLSPGVHRPLLIVGLAGFAAALGVLFSWKSAQTWLGENLPQKRSIPILTAVWFAFYPETVFLGSSQMREPFVITAIAVAFYGVTQVHAGRSRWMLPVVGGVISLLFFQPPLGLAALIVLLGTWLLESHHHFSWKVLAIFAVILLVVIVAAGAVLRSLPSLQSSSGFGIFLEWLQNNFGYQSHLAERASGMLQKVLDTVQTTLGEQWKLPVILVYGLAQPVLPATLVDEAAWIWRVINVLRALGWYIFAPLVFYALVALLRNGGIPRRRQLSWLALAVWIWALVAAANAGGDLWDNPRYRSIFLVWWALLAGWGWVHARQQQDAWLKRLLAVEAAFVLIFTEWYLSRIYPGIFFHLDIFVMFALTLLVWAAILVGGWWWDYRRKPRGS